jgi:ABC-type glutathione transport system ATPase component
MFVRLGFAVAVAADPDVLLVDEVLAVGDFAFQYKCFARMREVRAQGTTIVVVSHNVNVIRGFCDRSIVMSRGHKVFDGPTFDAISEFYSVVGKEVLEETYGAGEAHHHMAAVESLSIHAAGAEEPAAHFESGDDVVLRMRVRAETDVAYPVMGMTITTEAGTVVYSDTNLMQPFRALRAGEVDTYETRLRLPLTGGGYLATGTLHAADGANSILLNRAVPVTFYVSGRGMSHGLVDLHGSFHASGE